jgi:hypothetical protein
VAGRRGGSSTRDGWVGGTHEDWVRAMGIDWMQRKELVEAIPPAFTEYIGLHLRARLMLEGARA